MTTGAVAVEGIHCPISYFKDMIECGEAFFGCGTHMGKSIKNKDVWVILVIWISVSAVCDILYSKKLYGPYRFNGVCINIFKMYWPIGYIFDGYLNPSRPM